MPAVSFGGLASGLDTGAIVDALVQAEREPIRQMEQKKKTYDGKLNLFSQLNSKLSALRSAAQAINTSEKFRSFGAASSDETVATVSASGSASAGVYELSISRLAQAERSYSNSVLERDATNLTGSGTLSLRLGSDDEVAIEIDEAEDTLDSVAAKINGSGADVTASVVYDGSAYRLLVVGNRTGQSNGITFGETGTLAAKLGLSDSDVGDTDVAEKQAATSALVQMDDISFTSETNQLSEMLPGVTVDLRRATEEGEKLVVRVDVDASATEAKVKAFVEAYNSVASFLHQQFQFSGDKPVTNTLMGDSAARSVQTQLQAIVAAQVEGLDEGPATLAQIGIKSNRDGTLALDSALLSEQLGKNPSAVADLFVLDDEAGGNPNAGIAVHLEQVLDELLESTTGLIASRQEGIRNTMKTMSERIDGMETRLDRFEEALRRKYATLEQTMSSIQSQGSLLTAQLASLPKIR